MLLDYSSTFLLPITPRSTEHLWIVLTKPQGPLREAICAYITTLRSDSDTTVVVNVGDHVFIKHKSVINYSQARCLSLEAVDKLLSKRTHSFASAILDQYDLTLLEEIKEGLLRSKSTPNEIKAQFRQAWNIFPSR